LVVPAEMADRGNFLAFRSKFSVPYQSALAQAGIVTDVRGDVLRIGFGLYHDPSDTPGIAARILAAVQ
jgi:kynureninase